MKKILLTTLSMLFAVAAFAQKGTVTATILDAGNGETIAGAVLTIAPVKTPDNKQYATSAFKGVVSIPSLAYGEYTLHVAFLGYNEYSTTFKVAGAKTDLGKISLNPGLEIETVVKEVKAMRTSQKGDTVSYNAGAFKVTQDADVEGLLKKMPGITVDGGSVTAQGETVKKIFVDGKEFFGEDVASAIKSLPAETVDRVEVYNKLSDAAEFSGMDDGEGFKAINIVTHKNMRQGQFGKLTATYGYDPATTTESHSKYLVGGNVNMFHGDNRLTVNALFNNINQQDFMSDDVMGVMGGGGSMGGRRGMSMMGAQSGVANVKSFSANYTGLWGKRDQVTFQGGYSFNNTNTHNTSIVDKWYEPPMLIDTLSTIGNSNTLANNHRLSARIDWKISDNQELRIRPNFSYQSNDPMSQTLGWQYGAPNEIDKALGGSGYSRTDIYNKSVQYGYKARLGVVYRLKLGKPGRTLTVDADGSYNDNTSNSNSWSNRLGSLPNRPEIDTETGEWNPDAYTDRRYLYSNTPSYNYGVSSNVTYTEPLSKYSQLSLQYRISYDYQERDKRSYETNADFVPSGEPDVSLSNAYNSGYLKQSAGPGFRLSKDKNMFIANAYYQRSTLDGQVVREDSELIRHSYNNITYFMMGQLALNRENSLRLFVRSNTNNPSITNLQSVYDVSNAQNISRGNPNLNPAYSHSVNFHYVNSNVEKGRTLMWMFSFSTTSDYNATHTVQNPGSTTIGDKVYTPNYYSMPINMNGSRSVFTQLNYGFPIGFMKSNLNLSAGVSYSQTPSMLGGEIDWSTGLISNGYRNDTQNMGYSSSAILGSNISEKVDFTLSWSGNYNESTNSYNDNKTKNRYFYHVTRANMKFVLPLGFTLTGNAAYTQNIGFTNNYDDAYIFFNAAIGKKVFKSQRGEISFGVNDIFNQNKAFVRSVGTGYTQNTLNSVIGRYYMVQFTFNLRRFGKKGSTNMKDYDGGSSGGRRMGLGGHSGPPPGVGGGFH